MGARTLPALGVVYHTSIESPIGPLLLAGDRRTLRMLWFGHGRKAQGPDPGWVESADEFASVTVQLREYFAGRRTSFDIDVEPHGTDFQRRVWRALVEIPYGETTSYGALARRIGAEKAVRAVGLANGANPIAVVIPCHRVIGASGALTGFGGGLPTKRALLDLEQGQRTLL
ncbi:MAG: methylated-DNA--[protein]-cysteine S-methyltransferase [Acidobacteria bacterium]|nr:methylated-DNA--[protein]-cysteine S-methyltransferase [Acidobacteriota bacterium]